MASEVLRVDISVLSEPGAKSCDGWDGAAGNSKQWGWTPRTGYKGLWGKQQWRTGKSEKVDLLLMSDVCVIWSYTKQLSAPQQKTISQVVPDPPSFHRK